MGKWDLASALEVNRTQGHSSESCGQLCQALVWKEVAPTRSGLCPDVIMVFSTPWSHLDSVHEASVTEVPERVQLFRPGCPEGCVCAGLCHHYLLSFQEGLCVLWAGLLKDVPHNSCPKRVPVSTENGNHRGGLL